MRPAEFRFAGVRIHAICVDDVVQTIGQWISAKHRDFIVLTGAHGIVEMQSDQRLLGINNRAGLTTPDGMPVVWVGRLRGHKGIQKTYAPDIMDATFSDGVVRGYRHFLYGGDQGVADQLKEALQRKYPGIQVVGTFCPPFRALNATEVEEVTARINDARPDIVWVGIGCPKQEYWMDQFRPRL